MFRAIYFIGELKNNNQNSKLKTNSNKFQKCSFQSNTKTYTTRKQSEKKKNIIKITPKKKTKTKQQNITQNTKLILQS